MDSLLSYFFSTIPQVIAATIGLFGVFVLYKLNLIEKTLVGLAKSMLIELEDNNAYTPKEIEDNEDTLRRLKIGAEQGNPYKMKKYLSDLYTYFKQIRPGTNMYEQIILPFKVQMQIRNKLIEHSKIALLISIFLIFVSVLTIPFIKSILSICSPQSLNQYNCLSIILIIIFLVMFLIDLIFINWIIFKSFDTYQEIKTL